VRVGAAEGVDVGSRTVAEDRDQRFLIGAEALASFVNGGSVGRGVDVVLLGMTMAGKRSISGDRRMRGVAARSWWRRGEPWGWVLRYWRRPTTVVPLLLRRVALLLRRVALLLRRVALLLRRVALLLRRVALLLWRIPGQVPRKRRGTVRVRGIVLRLLRGWITLLGGRVSMLRRVLLRRRTCAGRRIVRLLAAWWRVVEMRHGCVVLVLLRDTGEAGRGGGGA
jgi:hypothetical protein